MSARLTRSSGSCTGCLRFADRSSALVSIRFLCASSTVAAGVGSAERHAVEPRHRLVRHRAAQFAERHVARRIGAEEIDQPRLVRRIAFALRLAHRQHHVAMRVVDGEHAVGAGDADLERIDRARPGHRQRPRDVEMIDRAVAHHDHAGGGVDALVERAQHLVDRARIAFDRRLRLRGTTCTCRARACRRSPSARSSRDRRCACSCRSRPAGS